MNSASNAATVPVGPQREYLETSPDGYRLTLGVAAMIVAFGASMLLINLGGVRALTFHEVIFAQPAREMLSDGHWIVPTIGGMPMLDKTPLTAWCIAGSMSLFDSRAEWVVRLPIVGFSILTALLVAAMTARWFGPRSGLIAGLMELTTVHLLGMGRLAEADMPLCCTVTAAMFAFAAAHVDGPCGLSQDRRLPWLFHFAVATSFLIKWLLGVAFIGAACLAWLVVGTRTAPQRIRVLKFLFSPLGLAIELLLVGGWCAAAYRIYPGMVDAFWFHHVGRARGGMGTLEPWYAYSYLIPFLVLPWAPYAAIAALDRLRGGRRFEPFWTLMLCWILPGALMLSLSTFRARNYAIPLTPPLVTLAAVGLHEFLKRREAALRPGQPALLAATALGGVAAIGVVLVRRPLAYAEIAVVLAAGLLGCIASLEFQRRRRAGLQLAALFAAVWFVSVGIQSWIMPYHDSFRPLAELGRRVDRFAPPSETVHVVGLPEVQIPFYIDRPLRSWFEFDRFFAATTPGDDRKGGPMWIVSSTDYLDRLREHGSVEVVDTGERKSRLPQDRDRLALLKFTPSATAAGVPSGELRR